MKSWEKNGSPATSSESFEQSFPAAVLSNCRIIVFSPARLPGTKICKFSSPGICTYRTNKSFRALRNSHTGEDNVNSAAISRALDALSLCKSKRKTKKHLISSEAGLSSAVAQNSSQLFCKPESKKIPVDFSRTPAISLKK
uniref:Uncharacterized protein n=1 Tax=Varanus komodoensis TaxID=61221 RepID=A0A8D2LPQ7_VARKO